MKQRGFEQIARYFEALSHHAGSDMLYRGHANINWVLLPSPFRPGSKGISNRRSLQDWSRLAGRFANPVPRNDIEWLVLAQHYGVPTMLLDWTESPLVALFFACLEDEDSEGCVWRVRASAFRQFYHNETVDPFREQRDQPGLIWATPMNARTMAQDSAMSLHTGPEDVIPDLYLKQIYVVPHAEKAHTLDALKVLGFTRERLFSDIALAVKTFLKDLAY